MGEAKKQFGERAEKIANSAQHSSVKRGILDNTLGFLNSTPPVAVLSRDECVQFVFFNRSEGVRGDPPNIPDYSPSESRGTILIITDKRVILLIGEEETDRVVSIPHGVIQGSSYKASLLGSNWIGVAGVSRISIQTADGEYSIPVIRATWEDVERGSHHIEAYSREFNGGEIEEFEPEVEYDPRSDGPELETIFVCRKCMEQVDRNIERCPHCNFHPQSDTRGFVWQTVSIGLLMTLLAPFGVAMEHDTFKKRRQAKRGVVIRKTAGVMESDHEDDEPDSLNQSSADKLRELSELQSDGVISSDEFENKKSEILSEY
ncbi:SHOCT domain-containing protein [Halobium salinum]|uniref:SHOCT domain-containing protein n=1 Tax=Halobium salinum TaxID=1364940 RepID=A0ABD5PEY9_9EURY|nr:SHOCT domain-containing protein [Halobium salinum]